jgi:hypothetical protein
MLDDQPTGPGDQMIRYDLRLDRQTIRDLREMAERQGCGIGTVIRSCIASVIAKAKQGERTCRP